MNDDDIKSRIVGVLRRDMELGVSSEEILTHDRLDELFGMDSVAVIELIIGIEREFGIKIPQYLLNMDVFGSLDSITVAVRGIIGKESSSTTE